MVNTLAGGLGVFVAGYLKSGFGLGGVFAGVAGILTLDAALLFAGYYFLLRKDLRSSGAIPTFRPRRSAAHQFRKRIE
jgi:hypothetical protein